LYDGTGNRLLVSQYNTAAVTAVSLPAGTLSTYADVSVGPGPACNGGVGMAWNTTSAGAGTIYVGCDQIPIQVWMDGIVI
jgi:hypothetical protein